MKKYRHIITVKGSYSFPIDMLRYDRMTPYHEEDSGKIGQSIHSHGTRNEEIQVLKADAPKNWTPTTGRWQSFGWFIIDHKIEEI
jgi:hypothetical protein